MKTKLLRRLRREGRCQIRVYSVRKDMDGTVVGIRYGYNSDEYAHLWHFAMTSDELKSEAMKIYILRRVAELRTAMSHTSELAEQEAEERMRDKAIEAFCKDCPIYSIQTSNGENCPDCSALNAFKQRLNEE